jgi:hypothetical protein
MFAPARACYEETEQWLASTEASALTHAELEDQFGAPGVPNVRPADAALNLPEEKQSHGLRKLAAAGPRKLAAAESARELVRGCGRRDHRASRAQAGKRQVERLARRAAADIDASTPGAGLIPRQMTTWWR